MYSRQFFHVSKLRKLYIFFFFVKLINVSNHLTKHVIEQVIGLDLAMDPQDIDTILTVFTTSRCQLLMTLKLLVNDHKRIQHTPLDTRHRIRQLMYFCLIHKSNLVCRQSTRMNKRCFSILCHPLKTTGALASTGVIDIEEIVAMFLHILAHDMKN